jgi:D-sedoheptulose 7-phosphate isomerase
MTDALQALYPFLYSGAQDAADTDRRADAVFAEIRQSTVDKAHEIIALRREVLRRDGERLAWCASAMAGRFQHGGRLFAFGNGGSATDAQDLAAQFMNPPGEAAPLPAVALTADSAVMTALTNDVGFDVVFSRQLAAFGRPDDIAVGLSTSGSSPNLLAAFDEARRRGMLTVGIAGYSGGRMADLASIDHLFVVPSASVHRIQEAQTTLYHLLAELAADGAAAGGPGA